MLTGPQRLFLVGCLCVQFQRQCCSIPELHSFISQSFASANDLHSELLSPPLAVHTPGSRCSLSMFLPDVEISIQGAIFSSSLVVLPCSDIVVILGMDWLVKHKAKIDCPS